MPKVATQQTSCTEHNHPDHESEISRLNRLSGQLDGVKKMIEDKRYCPDIITQLRAVQSAAKAIESNILQRHLETCVRNAFVGNEDQEQEEKIDELMRLFKKQ